MNIFENVAFGLKVKNVPESKIKEKVREMLKMVQLEGYEVECQVNFQVVKSKE